MNRQITCVIVFALVGLLVGLAPLNTTAAAGTGGNEPAMAKYVIYINWDAFRRDYYDWANQPGKPGTPNLNYLMSRGVYYPNTLNGFPSITNPMQTSIVTGSWPCTARRWWARRCLAPSR